MYRAAAKSTPIPVNAPLALQKGTVRRSWCIARLNKSTQIPVSAPVHTPLLLDRSCFAGSWAMPFVGTSLPSRQTRALLDTAQNHLQLYVSFSGLFSATNLCLWRREKCHHP